MATLLVQDSIPEFNSLPALTEAELHAIAEETSAVLGDLLANHTLSSATLRSYSSALRYWDAWHRASLGTQLPLLRTPRAPVPPETVAAFIAHHSPRQAGGLTEISMPAVVLARLQQIGAIGQRQVAKRNGKRATADVPSLATIEHRLAALSACHRLANLVPDFKDAPAVRQARRALQNRVSDTAPAMLRKPKMAAKRDVLNRMLETCLEDGLRGIRDAAILHVGFHGGGRRRSEIAAMRWADLTPIVLPEPIDGLVDGYRWELFRTKGRRRQRADKGVLTIDLLGFVAEAIDSWRDACIRSGLPLDEQVWYRVIKRRDVPGTWWPSTPMIPEDIRQVIRMRASAAGLNPDDFAGHSLRSGAATTFLEEGGHITDASRILDHLSSETTRKHYDHRDGPTDALARLVSRHPRGK